MSSRTVVASTAFQNILPSPSITSTNLQPKLSKAFDPESSVVFIGPRGSGKSSLAVIAGTLLDWPVVEADDYFQQCTGLTRSVFRKTHGEEEYRKQRQNTMQIMLSRNEKRCVFTCGAPFLAYECRMLLENFAERHPVIYVHREVEMIQSYLRMETPMTAEKYVQDMYYSCHQLCNFEYFNLSENWTPSSSPSAIESLEDHLPMRSFQRKAHRTLRHTKTDLKNYLRAVLGKSPHDSDGDFYTLFPPNPESRANTNSLAISLFALESNSLKLAEIQDGVDCVELVVDQPADSSSSYRHWNTLCRSIALIRRQLPVPIIFHLRLDLQYGYKTQEKLVAYFDLLRLGLRFATEYLTVDLRGSDEAIRELIAMKGYTKTLAHYVNRNPTADYWRSPSPMVQYQRARGLGCDLVRLCQPAISMSDNFSCFEFVAKVNRLAEHLPVIAYNLGSLGHLSVAFSQVLAPIIHQPLSSDLSPSMNESLSEYSSCTAKNIRQTLHSCCALDELKFYVFGVDVDFSMSPDMHNAAFEACGLPHFYDIRQISSLKEMEVLIKDPSFGGASISLPFKPEVICLVDSLSPSAKIIGAANTLLPIRELDGLGYPTEPRSKSQRNRSGRIRAFYGDNTDWMGIYACLLRYTSPANTVGPQTTALVVGAGGMARAAIYALAWLGVRRMFIFNRTMSNAESLAKYYNERTLYIRSTPDQTGSAQLSDTGFNLEITALRSLHEQWPRDYAYPSLVVNTVPAHQIGSTPPPHFRMPVSWLQNPTGGVVLELSYHKPDTPLLEQIRGERDRGWIGVDPIEVFFEQGCAQFELFTGCKAPREKMWEACLRQYTTLVPCAPSRTRI